MKANSIVRKGVYKAFLFLGGGEVKALEKDSKDPRAAQLRKLKEIIERNAETIYGKEHGFACIKGLADFRAAVKINDYEALRPYIDRMMQGEKGVLTCEEPFMFATTSGTMGKQKFIPVTPSYIKEFRHASVASGYYSLKSFPGIADGVILSVFSPAKEGASTAGIPYGAISGALYEREPWLVKKFISPIPYPVYQIRDYESKYYTLLRVALNLPIACFYTLNPSTIVVLLKRLELYAQQLIKDVAEGTITTPSPLTTDCLQAIAPFLKPDPEKAKVFERLLEKKEFVPHKIWPNLQAVNCWTKAAAAFYLADFERYFGPVPVRDITYGASEGRGTVSLGDGRQLLSIRSHFFEFIPEAEIENPNPQILLADEVEVGKNYYILFSTSAGLYRYHINDVIKVTGFYNRTPLIEFQYKGGNVSSFTGEKLTELQVVEAMSQLCQTVKNDCRFFTLLPEFKPNPHYRLLIELNEAAEYEQNVDENKLLRLAEIYDGKLSVLNVEYASKRQSGRLDPVVVRLLRHGAYERLRKKLVAQGVADAQIKLSHLNPKAETRDFFLQETIN